MSESATLTIERIAYELTFDRKLSRILKSLQLATAAAILGIVRTRRRLAVR